ncbi:hypothetical protein [Pyxidicoccus trucidator]|uniref:hypothetical protein n=1 Tax=Pyxidicoccus trucidator TaxID=2709662 RepID=UPI001F079401|nr:hypothetical protein [Pyxidicoccus trucidator]
MKLFRKTPPSSPRIDTATPPKSPKGSPSSSPKPSRTDSPSSRPSSSGRRQDDFDTGAARTRPRRLSTSNTDQVRGPDASGAKKPTSNSDIRKWYLDKVKTIPELDKKWAAEGVPLQERARRAVEIRHDARLEARKMMKNPLEVALLRARDFFTYGSINGPSFNQLVKKAEAKGLQGDEVWKELLGSSNRTNQTVNQHILGNTQATP